MKKESKGKKLKPRTKSKHATRSSTSRAESQAVGSQETTCALRLTLPQTKPLAQPTQVNHVRQVLSSQQVMHTQQTSFVARGLVRDLGDAGEGIAALRSELPQLDGRIAFLEGALPGDKIILGRSVLSSLEKQGPLHLKKTDFVIEEASPYRQTAFCPVFPDCGGCTLQELQYPESLKFKSRKVRELLIRIGKIPQAEAEKLVRPCLGMVEPFRFRSRVQIKVQARRDGKIQTTCHQEGAAQSGQAQISKAPAENPCWGQAASTQAEKTEAIIPQLGFFKRDSHEIADFSFCAIQPRAFDDFREAARHALGGMLASGGEAARAAEMVSELQLRQNHQGNHFLVVVVCSSAAGERRQESGKNCMKKQRGASSDSQQKLQSPDAPPQTESFFPLTNALEQEAQRQGVRLSLWLNIKAASPSADYVESPAATNFIKLSGPDQLEDIVLGLRYALSPQAFSQTNLVQDEVLYQTALSMIDEYVGQSEEAPSILELYCGSGIISLLLARHFPDADISAVEIVPAAVRDARANAALNGLDQQNLRFICGDASEADAKLDSRPYTLIVVDPPRQGLAPGLCRAIDASGAPFLLYISCNPATLARDIARLSPAYQLKAVQPVDMFPWTGHVETVALLSKLNTEHHLDIEIGEDELSEIDFSKDATYGEIKKYVLDKYGLKVSSLYIAQIKRKHGLIERENYNFSKKENQRGSRP